MRGSLLAAVFMPCLQNGLEMDLDHSPDHIQLSGPEAVITGKPKWLEPEFAGPALALDMNMRWLITVEAREEEPIRPRKTMDSRHSEPSLP
jgi:hypothetical protein